MLINTIKKLVLQASKKYIYNAKCSIYLTGKIKQKIHNRKKCLLNHFSAV